MCEMQGPRDQDKTNGEATNQGDAHQTFVFNND